MVPLEHSSGRGKFILFFCKEGGCFTRGSTEVTEDTSLASRPGSGSFSGPGRESLPNWGTTGLLPTSLSAEDGETSKSP